MHPLGEQFRKEPEARMNSLGDQVWDGVPIKDASVWATRPLRNQAGKAQIVGEPRKDASVRVAVLKNPEANLNPLGDQVEDSEPSKDAYVWCQLWEDF